jgi:hypothetical protein
LAILDYRATALTVRVGVFVHGVQNSEEFVNAELQGIQGDQGLTRVTVTVSWDGGDSYATTGVVSRW